MDTADAQDADYDPVEEQAADGHPGRQASPEQQVREVQSACIVSLACHQPAHRSLPPIQLRRTCCIHAGHCYSCTCTLMCQARRRLRRSRKAAAGMIQGRPMIPATTPVMAMTLKPGSSGLGQALAAAQRSLPTRQSLSTHPERRVKSSVWSFHHVSGTCCLGLVCSRVWSCQLVFCFLWSKLLPCPAVCPPGYLPLSWSQVGPAPLLFPAPLGRLKCVP